MKKHAAVLLLAALGLGLLVKYLRRERLEA